MQIMRCTVSMELWHAAKSTSRIKAPVEVCKCNQPPYNDTADIPVYSNYIGPKNLGSE